MAGSIDRIVPGNIYYVKNFFVIKEIVAALIE